MDDNKELRTITVKNVSGEDAFDIFIQVTQKEYDLMEEMRRLNPDKWDGKDLELLNEVRKIINDKENYQSDSGKDTTELKHTEDDQTSGSKKDWLWILGILIFLFVIIRIVTYTMTRTAMEKLSKVIDNTTATVSYHGVSFDYGYGWDFEKEEIAEGVYYISGENSIGMEQGVVFMENTGALADDIINNIISGYKTSGDFQEVKQDKISKIKYNGLAAKAANFTLKLDGEMLYAKTIVIINDGYTFVITQIAPSEKQLSSYDFRLMEDSFKFKNN